MSKILKIYIFGQVLFGRNFGQGQVLHLPKWSMTKTRTATKLIVCSIYFWLEPPVTPTNDQQWHTETTDEKDEVIPRKWILKITCKLVKCVYYFTIINLRSFVILMDVKNWMYFATVTKTKLSQLQKQRFFT